MDSFASTLPGQIPLTPDDRRTYSGRSAQGARPCYPWVSTWLAVLPDSASEAPFPMSPAAVNRRVVGSNPVFGDSNLQPEGDAGERQLPQVVRGGFGGAGLSEEGAATSNSSRGPMCPEHMGVAATDVVGSNPTRGARNAVPSRLCWDGTAFLDCSVDEPHPPEVRGRDRGPAASRGRPDRSSNGVRCPTRRVRLRPSRSLRGLPTGSCRSGLILPRAP